jgi:8-oxo-dGTP pyrophosphatase MutT (NUDIX family)
MQLTTGDIKRILSQSLPADESHTKMLPVNRRLTGSAEELAIAIKSSVLLLVTKQNQQWMALLIKRPAHMKNHAGQIALPGGRIETGESPIETALRETWEEIGASADNIEILGQLSDLYIHVSKFLIFPFVGYINDFKDFKVNKNEVEKTIAFPLRLMESEITETTLQTHSGWLNVPCIKFEGEIIWGATSMILTEFSDAVKKSGFSF